MPACLKRTEVAVRIGQNDQIRRILTGIIGRFGFFQTVAFAEDHMHVRGP